MRASSVLQLVYMGDVIAHLGTLLAPPLSPTSQSLPFLTGITTGPLLLRSHSPPAPSFSQPKKKLLRDVYLCSTASCFISHVHTLSVST